jgi:predicted enzyme related to lactoylglutathione lyase
MDVWYAYAGLSVSDRDDVAAWYEGLFGRPPDMLPNDNEATWRVTESASLYIVANGGRAGGGVVTLMVDDLESTLSELAARGMRPEREESMEAGRKAMFVDPDGNSVALAQLAGGRVDEAES